MSLWEKTGDFLGGLIGKKRANDKPPWLEFAEGELGVAEIPGLKHADAIVEYHKSTDGKMSPDELAWCSSFVNWCMVHAGIPGTNSKAARSWLAWGHIEDPFKPRLGAVTILKRGKDWQGHVGFYLGRGISPDRIVVLGGNQGNRVSKQEFPTNQVLGYRWPKEGA